MSHADKPSPRFRKLSAGRSFDDKDQRLRKTRALSIYLSPDENRMVRLEAERRGLGLSDFLRHQALLEVRYGRNSLIEQIQQLAHDNRNDPEVEHRLRALVEDLTGVALAPPVAPTAPEPAPVAATPPAPPVPLPSASASASASVDLPVQLANPEADRSPVPLLQRIGAITLTVLGDLLDAAIDLVAAIWRRLNRAKWHDNNTNLYDRVLGRTPLQFLLTAAMLAALPFAIPGQSVNVLGLLFDNDAVAAAGLEQLPEDAQRRHFIGSKVEEIPTNVVLIDACLRQQHASKSSFWCKFRMKAGA